MKRAIIRHGLAAIMAGILVSCGESTVTGPSRTNLDARSDSANFLFFPPKPLYCPATTTESTTGVLDALGGLLSVGGTSVLIPAGALLQPVTVTLTVPASNYMEIDVSVEGTESFIFETPITVNVSYARCNSLLAKLLPLQAWHWDPETRKLLEQMVGIDNKLTQTVTFTTIHLSGYVIAN